MNPLIIKLGGVLLDSEEALARLFDALLAYRNEHQRPLIIVHGGGCLVDELMKKLALPVKKKNGLRVTPADQIDHYLLVPWRVQRTRPCWPGRRNMALVPLAYASVMRAW